MTKTTLLPCPSCGNGARRTPCPVCNVKIGKPKRVKSVHYVKGIREDGAVSALCFSRPCPINLKISTWTNRREAVTCKKCQERLSMTGTTFTPEQIEEIETMITSRLTIFHDALIERDQISPPSAASRIVYGEERSKPKLEVVTDD